MSSTLIKTAMTTLVRLLCRQIHMGRIVPEVDRNLAQQIEDESVNVKRLRTRRNMGMVRLPAQLELIAQDKISKIADSKFRSEAKELIRIMHALKLPDERSTLAVKRADIKTSLEVRDKLIMRPDYDPARFTLKEEMDRAKDQLTQLIEGTLEDRRRDWHYYEYDEHASNLYLATRLAPNYSCIKTVMDDIRDLDPTFQPRSVLDFGSGMGTTIWAVNETWPNSVSEFMNVDISKEQQYLCEYLLRGGKEFGDHLPGIFHRQYLPASTKAKYDMVVAAFTMLELPNSELRANTIESLWHKTNDLLVIIERGNKGGFTVINEARHFILDLGGHNVTRKLNLSLESRPSYTRRAPESHVLAPCSHEFLCPRTSMPDKKKIDICRFRVNFEPLELGEKKRGFLREEFSYVVLRKGPRRNYPDEDNSRWPRIVEKRGRSGGQIKHKLCCPNGCLAETVITKKYGRAAYNLAKSCDWGDILPIRVKDTYISKSSFIDEKTKRDDGDSNKSHE